MEGWDVTAQLHADGQDWICANYHCGRWEAEAPIRCDQMRWMRTWAWSEVSFRLILLIFPSHFFCTWNKGLFGGENFNI